MKKLFAWLCIISLAYGCHSAQNKKAKDSSFKKSLIERRIPQSDFVIGLPANYVLTKRDGPDFSVYYIRPTDTLNKSLCLSGFYWGNFPGEFGNPADCKPDTLAGYLLGNRVIYNTYNCKGRYTIQAITDNPHHNGWDMKIHVFGRAGSKAELNKLLDIYSSINYKKQTPAK